MYKAISFVKSNKRSFEGIILECKDKKFVTNGVYIWELTDKRKNELYEVKKEDIDLSGIIGRLNKR